MAFAAAGRSAAAKRVMDTLLRSDVGVAAPFPEDALAPPFCEALLAFSRGDYSTSVERLARVRYIAHRCGGSLAQCDLIHLTFTEAALRAGQAPLARALVAERAAQKPASRLNHALRKRLSLCGTDQDQTVKRRDARSIARPPVRSAQNGPGATLLASSAAFADSRASEGVGSIVALGAGMRRIACHAAIFVKAALLMLAVLGLVSTLFAKPGFDPWPPDTKHSRLLVGSRGFEAARERIAPRDPQSARAARQIAGVPAQSKKSLVTAERPMDATAGSVPRVSASDVEALIAGAIRANSDVDQGTPDRELIQSHLHRAIVHRDSIAITLRREDLADADEAPVAVPAISIAFTPTVLPRKGFAHVPPSDRQLDEATRLVLLRTIARSRDWIAMMIADPETDFEAIAWRENLAERYVRLLAPLAYLSPRIIEAIASGSAPADLTVRQLIRNPPLPGRTRKRVSRSPDLRPTSPPGIWRVQKRRRGYGISASKPVCTKCEPVLASPAQGIRIRGSGG
jgi:hypothetical protein